jgi:glucose-6-phosphate isomerase
MDQITFSYEKTCRLQPAELHDTVKELNSEIERITQSLTVKAATDYAFARVPFDEVALQKIQTVVQQKKALQPAAIVVIGIGGSNLGTVAVQQALYGQFYNEQQPGTKIYYVDTVDSDRTMDIVLLMEQELQQEKNIILNIVSKSGTTLETLANAEVFFALLKQYRKEIYHEYVVVTTDKDSPLWQLGKQEHFTCLEVPESIGGRFSVFTAVSLFPLGLIGVDIQQLLQGAAQATQWCTQGVTHENPAAVSAAILKLHYFNKIIIHDTFLFSSDLESVGKWYRQLLAESIGKEFDHDGRVVEVGITPTVSIGSTDLHSVGQLYLGGPRDKFISFVAVDVNNSEVIIPEQTLSQKCSKHLAGKSFAIILDAILQGVSAAYMQAQRPYASWRIPAKKPLYIGQFLQCKLFEVVYLGYLLNINPFDQPNVEKYKQETGRILGL